MGNNSIGLVLCGGQSSRMGSDKGLIQNNNLSWAKMGFEKLSQALAINYVSINASQSTEYAKIFSKNNLIFDTKLEIKGPLLGILSTHLQFPELNILVLACDMIEIQTENISKLLLDFNHQSALCFTYNNQPEPLLGMYSSWGLKKIYSQYSEGKLLKFSMMYILDLLEAKYIPLAESEFSAFKNFNYPQDIEQIGNETIA